MAYGKKIIHIERISHILDRMVDSPSDLELELESDNEAKRMLFKLRQAIYIARLNRDKHPHLEKYAKLNRYQFRVEDNKVIGKYKGVKEIKFTGDWGAEAIADRIVSSRVIEEPIKESKIIRGITSLMDIVEYLMDIDDKVTHIQFPEANKETLNVSSLNNWLVTRGWIITNTLPIEVKKDGE